MIKCLVEDSLVGSFIIRDGRFVYVNPRLADTFGYTREELLELEHVLELVHPDDRERVRKDISVLTGNVGRKITTRCRALKKDGAVLHVEALAWGTLLYGAPSITGSFMDISDRLLAEDSLKESEKALRTIIDSVYDAVFIHDGDGVIMGVNGKMLEMYRVERADAMRYNFDDGYSSPDNPADKLRGIWEKVLEGEERSFEWKARRPGDGSEFHVEVHLRKVRLWERDVILANVRDISMRKQEEKERSALYHMMTHDIKGPLSIIYGYGDIIATMVEDPDVIEMVMEVKKAANRISNQVSDMLEISKLEYGESKPIMETVDLGRLLRDVAEEHVFSSQESGVNIVVEMDEEVGNITADPGQLMRAVGNLVSNAVVYCGHGCLVTVRSGVSRTRPGFVFIEVEDTGSGIPEEDIPFIFDKYYRSSKTFKKRGTGLGLAIVKAVAQSHGGSVELESEEGVGSTFRLFLPAG